MAELATIVPLKHKITDSRGNTQEVLVTFGSRKKVIPFDVQHLKSAQKIVVKSEDPARLFLMSKTVFKGKVLAEYKHIMSNKKANKQSTKGIIFKAACKTHKDDQIALEDMTLVDIGKPSGTTTLVLGSSMTGKTTALVHAMKIINKQKYYDVVICFTESINAAPLEGLPKTAIVSQAFFPRIVKLAFDINRATNNRYRYLFILDDITNFRGKDTFQKMILTYRNSGISTLVLTQYSKLVAPSQRDSIHRIFFTGAKSGQERDFVVKNWLRGYIQDMGIKKHEDQVEWFRENTKLGEGNDKNGKFIMLDNITDEMSVQVRPK
jgi:hypothetical protein